VESAFWHHTYDYIKHCADNGVIFNSDKFDLQPKYVITLSLNQMVIVHPKRN